MWGWHTASPIFLVPRPKPVPAPKSRAARVQSAGTSSSSSLPSLISSRLPLGPALRERSRSPLRDGLPGLRGDAPGRRARVSAHLPQVLSTEDKEEALRLLDRDVLAATTNRPHAARLNTIELALSLWGCASVATHTHVAEGPCFDPEAWGLFFCSVILDGLHDGGRATWPRFI